MLGRLTDTIHSFVKAAAYLEQLADGVLVTRHRIEVADVDGPPLVRIVADFWPDRLLSDVRPVCAGKARWPRWCSLRTLQTHGRHRGCQCNLRISARIDRPIVPSTRSCKFDYRSTGAATSQLASWARFLNLVSSLAACCRRPRRSSAAKRCARIYWRAPPPPAWAVCDRAWPRAMVMAWFDLS